MIKDNTEYEFIRESQGKYEVFVKIKKKEVHIGYFESFKHAKILNGLIECQLKGQNLNKVRSLQTYFLTKFDNILRIMEKAKASREKIDYKKTRKYYSMTDLYGEGYTPSGTEDFDFGDKYKKYWDKL